MNFSSLLIVAIATAICSAVLTKILIQLSDKLGLTDVPNSRSSHVRPTPRGGGVAIIISCIFGASLSWVLQIQDMSSWIYPMTLAFFVGFIGLLDDKYSISVRSRIFVHAVCSIALMASVWTQRPNFIYLFPGFLIPASILVYVIFCVLFIWLINLYNFMDGIDGIAAGEALSVGLWMTALSYWQGQNFSVVISVLLVASSFGFLLFNWSPAKIFMGDVGSGFLGFYFAVIISLGLSGHGLPLVTCLILLGLFLVDTGYTITIRIFHREAIFKAHRDHAYQHSVQRGYSHGFVSSACLVINFIWLGPMAALTLIYSERSFLFLGIAYLPLLILAVLLKAGSQKKSKKENLGV